LRAQALQAVETFEDRAVVDACALANARSADALLRLSREGACTLYWSQKILEETRRTQSKKFKWGARVTDSYHAKLAEKFPTAVVFGFEHWIEQCTNDEGDRHVLACAVEARVRYIVTFNVRHFKDADLTRWNIRALSPNDYLLMLYLRDETLFEKQFIQAALKKKKTAREFASGLLRDCKSFAELMLRELPEE